MKICSYYTMLISWLNCFKINSSNRYCHAFMYRTEDDKRDTRLSLKQDQLYISKYRTKRLQRSIKYRGAKTWNISCDVRRKSYQNYTNSFKQLFLQ